MEDKELVEQILKHGNSRYYGTIVSRYSRLVYSKTIPIVRRDELTREVVQQTFVKAFDRLDCWNGKSLSAWLVAIAMHTALNILDKERRRRAHSVDDVDIADNDNHSDEHENMLQRMEKAIDKLKDEDKTIIQLHYYKRMKTEEIARKTGMSQQNILVKLHRIREKLRKELIDGTDER